MHRVEKTPRPTYVVVVLAPRRDAPSARNCVQDPSVGTHTDCLRRVRYSESTCLRILYFTMRLTAAAAAAAAAAYESTSTYPPRKVRAECASFGLYSTPEPVPPDCSLTTEKRAARRLRPGCEATSSYSCCVIIQLRDRPDAAACCCYHLKFRDHAAFHGENLMAEVFRILGQNLTTWGASDSLTDFFPRSDLARSDYTSGYFHFGDRKIRISRSKWNRIGKSRNASIVLGASGELQWLRTPCQSQ